MRIILFTSADSLTDVKRFIAVLSLKEIMVSSFGLRNWKWVPHRESPEYYYQSHQPFYSAGKYKGKEWHSSLQHLCRGNCKEKEQRILSVIMNRWNAKSFSQIHSKKSVYVTAVMDNMIYNNVKNPTWIFHFISTLLSLSCKNHNDIYTSEVTKYLIYSKSINGLADMAVHKNVNTQTRTNPTSAPNRD